MKTIYADYQATTPLDHRVLVAMEPFWRERFGNPHSSNHVLGWRAYDRVEECASSIAEAIGAEQDEIVFTSGATEANNLALLGLAENAEKRKYRILISAIEHKCVLSSARYLVEKKGFKVEEIPVDRYGSIDQRALQNMLDDSVLLVSIMAVNNEIGTIQDISAIGQVLKAANIHFHCDAAQAPCSMDMTDLTEHADMVSISSHKMYGPPGIGALYIRREIQESCRPIIHGGGQQNGLRSGTLPLPLCVGMACALEVSPDRQERERISIQRDTFIKDLFDSEFEVHVNGPAHEKRHAGNANLLFKGFDAEDILQSLQPFVAASTGSACTTGIPETSHVLRAIGLPKEDCEASIRFSFGRFTTDDDIANGSELIATKLKELR